MHITHLVLKNCLGIKELELTPGAITIIEGSEGQGKTSILESIQRFFWNKSERSGAFVYKDEEGTAEKAETYLDLDDGTAMKKYVNKEGKVTTVAVVKDGMSPPNVETFLKSLVDERQLNPISLIAMKDKELADLILSLMPITVTEEDLKEWLLEVPPYINCKNHGLQVCKDVEELYFKKRADVNRNIKDLTSEIKADIAKLPSGYDVETWKNVSLTEKYEAIKKASKINEDRAKCQAQIENVQLKIDSINEIGKSQLEQLEEAIRIHKNNIAIKIETEKENARIATEYLEKHQEVDIEPLEVEHKQAEEMKSYIRTADDLKVKESDLAAKEIQVKDLTGKIEFMRLQPQMLLSKAKMPVPGITVDGGNVLINGRPIINLSGGERIKFVMNIVREMAGELKIILIDGFEKLSPKGQEEFIKECEGDGFQYVITKVTDGELKITTTDADGRKIDGLTGEVL